MLNEPSHTIDLVHVRVNIMLCREVFWITANVEGILRLINADVVDDQMCRESEVLEINISEVRRHPEISNDILFLNVSATMEISREADTIGSCGTGLAEICTALSAPTPGAIRVHATLLSEIHVIYCSKMSTQHATGVRNKDALRCQILE